MPSPTAENLASRLRQMRQSSRAQRTMPDGSARELIVVAFAVPVVTILVTAVVVLTVLLSAGSGLDGLATAVGAIWLAIHQVPLTMSGVTVGVLPLLPTIAVAAGAARMAGSVSGPERPTSELVAVVFAALGGPMLMTALSLAVVMDGSSVFPVQSPAALTAFGYTAGIHAAAATLGILWQRRSEWYDRFGITPAVRRGARLGMFAVVALLTCAAALVVIRLVMGWGVVGDLIGGGSDFDGYLGLTALSVLYLPNAVIGAAAVLVGSDVHVGGATVDLLDVHGGPVPPLPVLGVLPENGAGMLGILGFVIPASIALLVAWRCRDIDPLANVRSVAVAGAVAASMMVVLCSMAGGVLGEFGDAGVTLPTAGVFTLGWIAVTGMVVALIYGTLPSTRAAREALDVDDEFFEGDESGYEDDYLTADDDWEYDEGYDAWAEDEWDDQWEGDEEWDGAEPVDEIGEYDTADDHDTVGTSDEDVEYSGDPR
ncbi:low temperature viability 1 family protein [Gordonia sp. SID5947]|uniref:low temperature viability 1 family protein n=1 Tax=Gordonia sp. SID5947 TaxID=2690315 RepID=UPI001F2545D4|nr:low temperature viability 1 family protein [Gordonia sp. SID5947]